MFFMERYYLLAVAEQGSYDKHKPLSQMGEKKPLGEA
jgi:hypothetical protein